MTTTEFTALLWIAFVAYWFAAARGVKRTVAEGQSRVVRFMALVFMAFVPALWYLPLGRIPLLGWRLVPRGAVPAVAGMCILLTGLLLAVWARRVLADNWSGAAALKENHSLITSGPYRIVRHPIYLGVLSAMLGTALVIGEIRAFLPLLGVFGIWKKMDAEEALLRSAFAENYEAYAKTVKRLIPGIL